MSTKKLIRFSSKNIAARQRRSTLNPKVGRRSFLKLSAATAVLSTTALTSKMTRKSFAADKIEAYTGSKTVRTICAYCAVGCGVVAEVQNGVWVRQEVAQDHPVSSGGHCCKGASAIDMVIGEKRLKSPMKRVGGKWQNISWDQAFDEICTKLKKIRETDGPDALHFNGSAKVSNEMAYLQRKFAAFWGSNNVDHQARI